MVSPKRILQVSGGSVFARPGARLNVPHVEGVGHRYYGIGWRPVPFSPAMQYHLQQDEPKRYRFEPPVSVPMRADCRSPTGTLPGAETSTVRKRVHATNCFSKITDGRKGLLNEFPFAETLEDKGHSI